MTGDGRGGAVALTVMLACAGLTVSGLAVWVCWHFGWTVLSVLPGALVLCFLYILFGLLTGRYSRN